MAKFHTKVGQEVSVFTHARGGGASISAGYKAACRKLKQSYIFGEAESNGYDGYDKARDLYRYKFTIVE